MDAGRDTGMDAGADSIAILMGCRDGARFLPEQLASIAAQSHCHWRLVASDDGSTDATRAILAAFRDAQAPGRVEIRDGPARGFAANYLAPRRRSGDPCRLVRLRRPGRRLAPRPAGARRRAPRARCRRRRPALYGGAHAC